MNALGSKRILVAAGLCLASASALAQYAPDATMDLGTGYGQIALSQSTLSATRQIGKQPASSKVPAQQASQPSRQRMLALMQSLEPEYNHRVRTDGEASAKRWLAQKAWEMGRREGAAARRSR